MARLNAEYRNEPVPGSAGKTGTPTPSGLGAFLRLAPKIISARESFRLFFYLAARDERGEKMAGSPVHDFLCDLFQLCWAQKPNQLPPECREDLSPIFQGPKNLSVVAMPGLGKTTIAAHFPVWVLGLDPAETVACVSADMGDSTDQVSYIRSLVLEERMKDVFPSTLRADSERADAKRGWEKGRFFLKQASGGVGQTPSVQSISATPTKERVRISCAVFDDLNTRRVAYSAPIRQRLQESFENTWAGRLQNSRGGFGKDGWALSLQNCWLQADLGHVLAGREGFASVWLGVNESRDRCLVLTRNLDNPNNPLVALPDAYGQEHRGIARRANKDWEAWTLPLPPGMTTEALSAAYSDNPGVFMRSHRLVAPDAADLLFLDWRNCEVEGTAAEILKAPTNAEGLPIYSPDVLDNWTLTAGIDVSGRGRSGNAISVWARDKSGRKLRCEVWKFGGGYATIIERLNELESRGARFRLVNFESNAIQDELRKAILEVQRARSETADAHAPDWTRRMVGFYSGNNKWEPGKGLPALALEMAHANETGAVAHPTGSGKLKHTAGEGFRALETALDESPQSIAANKTPDVLMADWFAWSAASDILGGGRAHAAGTSDKNQPLAVPMSGRKGFKF